MNPPERHPIQQWSDEHLPAQFGQAAGTYDSDHLMVLFVAHHANRTIKTLKAYRDAIQTYVDWAKKKEIDLLTPRSRDDEAYLHHLASCPSLRRANHGITAATARQHIAAIRGLYRTFRWADATAHNFLQSVRLPTDTTPDVLKNPPYAQRDVEAMLGVAQPLERALVLACGHSGPRVSEASSLAADQSSVDKKLLTITGKQGRMHTVPLSARTRKAFPLLSPHAAHVFPCTYRQATDRLLRAC